ncbi:MAG: PD40 domain-containing protein, partial [Flavobacteriaceae bacterium]
MKFKTLITGLLSLCACLACMNKKDHAIAEDKTTDRQEENTKTMLSDEYGSDLGPQFSPDGQKIAFYSYLKSDPSVGRIFIMNKDGSQIKELTSRDTVGMHTEPKWSDNGKKIGYTSFRENGAKIMAIDIDGDQPKPLASITEDGYHMFSCWDAKGDGYYFFHWPAGGFTPDAYYANKTEIIKLTEDGISCRPQLTADGTLFVSKIVDL